jgi:hypothetical protein
MLPSQPDQDFTGGDNVLVEQRHGPSRGRWSSALGRAKAWCSRQRASGAIRHAWIPQDNPAARGSEIRSGLRYTLPEPALPDSGAVAAEPGCPKPATLGMVRAARR